MIDSPPSTINAVNERLSRFLTDLAALMSAAIFSLFGLIGVINTLRDTVTLPLTIAAIVLLGGLGVGVIGFMSRQRARVDEHGVVFPWILMSRFRAMKSIMWDEVENVEWRHTGSGWLVSIQSNRLRAYHDLASNDLENPGAAGEIIRKHVRKLA